MKNDYTINYKIGYQLPTVNCSSWISISCAEYLSFVVHVTIFSQKTSLSPLQNQSTFDEDHMIYVFLLFCYKFSEWFEMEYLNIEIISHHARRRKSLKTDGCSVL